MSTFWAAGGVKGMHSAALPAEDDFPETHGLFSGISGYPLQGAGDMRLEM